jgi:hypothetical protein
VAFTGVLNKNATGPNCKNEVNLAMIQVFKAKLDNRNPRNSGGITGS